MHLLLPFSPRVVLLKASRGDWRMLSTQHDIGGDNCDSNHCDRPHEVHEPIIILSVTMFLLYVCRLEAEKKHTA